MSITHSKILRSADRDKQITEMILLDIFFFKEVN